MPTLRFDWHGSGESAGEDGDPARVLAWLESLRGAIQRLRDDTGVSEIVLVGLRMGATMAALVAEEMNDIQGLALLAPVVSGKAYVREMRALAAFGLAGIKNGLDKKQPEAAQAESNGDIEAAGFVLSARTADDLRGLDLLQTLRRRPAGRVLLMHRPDAPTDPRLAARLKELGAEVAESDIPDYGEWVCDSEWSTAPRIAFDRLVAWLRDGARERPLQLALPAPARVRLPGAVEESIALVGRADLVATACTPSETAADADRPALLFLNTGWYARMGANRIAVTLARRYAAQGFTSLRLDLAGVGDSEAASDTTGETGSLVYNLKSCTDVVAALDWLEARGHKRVVVFGMCSGAYLGFQAAQRDTRIVGQVLVNPQRFEWTQTDSIELVNRVTGQAARHLLRDGLRAVMRPGKLGRLLSGDPAAWRMARAVGERTMNALRRRVSSTTPDTAVARDMRMLFQRGVKTLLVFSAGDAGLAECAHQFGEELELLNADVNLGFEIIEGATHTLAERRSRAALERLLDAFLAPWVAAVSQGAKAA